MRLRHGNASWLAGSGTHDSSGTYGRAGGSYMGIGSSSMRNSSIGIPLADDRRSAIGWKPAWHSRKSVRQVSHGISRTAAVGSAFSASTACRVDRGRPRNSLSVAIGPPSSHRERHWWRSWAAQRQVLNPPTSVPPGNTQTCPREPPELLTAANPSADCWTSSQWIDASPVACSRRFGHHTVRSKCNDICKNIHQLC